jgi:cell division septation protein DedD
VFAMRRKGNMFTSGPDRWLVLAGAGLLVLGLVLRLLTDIGRSTAAGDTATPVADTRALPEEPALGLPPTTADTLAASTAVPGPPPISVAEPVPVKPSAPAIGAAPATLAATGWSVQLGAFGQAANAQRLAGRVRNLGYEASVVNAGKLTKVRVEGLADRRAAEAAADSIARVLDTKGVVVGPGR